MEQAFLIREMIISVFKRHETIILFCCKLLVGMFLFGLISGIGYAMPQVAVFFTPPYRFPYMMLMSVLFAICPVSVAFALVVVNIGLQLSGSVGLFVLVTLFLLAVMFLYVRFSVKESVLILATFLGFYFKMPYVVPLIAGLYFSLTSVIPVIIGVFIWYFVPVAGDILKQGGGASSNLMEIPDTVGTVYFSVFDSVKGGADWVFTAFIFAIMIIIVYIIARSALNHAKDLAVGIGAALCIVSFILVVIIAGVNVHIFPMIILTILSALIVEGIRFFDVLLDYQRVEHVQFEDETNYYIVKIVPKIIMSRRQSVLKRITPQDDETEPFENR